MLHFVKVRQSKEVTPEMERIFDVQAYNDEGWDNVNCNKIIIGIMNSKNIIQGMEKSRIFGE